MPHHWVQTVPFTPAETPYHLRPKLGLHNLSSESAGKFPYPFGASEALTINLSLSDQTSHFDSKTPHFSVSINPKPIQFSKP
jgi:hypothetical protein